MLFLDIYCRTPTGWGGRTIATILDQLYHKKQSVLSCTLLRTFKSRVHKVLFLTIHGNHFPPQDLKHSSLRPGSVYRYLRVLELIRGFPFLQRTRCKLLSEDRQSNNLLQHTKEQRLLLEQRAGLAELREQVST